ncbi:MAG: VWA domain-containing protein [Nitrososphaeraceae archaeon]
MTFDLSKVQFVLDKRQINNIPCQVKFGMDVSGSTKPLYKSGIIQTVTERIFNIAMSVDMDKILDFYVFDDATHKLSSVTESNILNYISNNVLRKGNIWGGTNYAPIIKEICNSQMIQPSQSIWQRLFKKQLPTHSNDPTLAIIITDGENFDKHETEHALTKTQHLNIYWQMVGVGIDSDFRFLSKLAKNYDNVGFTPITDLSVISDEDLYDQLLNDEFAGWVKQFK